jgi:hypothetical protein
MSDGIFAALRLYFFMMIPVALVCWMGYIDGVMRKKEAQTWVLLWPLIIPFYVIVGIVQMLKDLLKEES